MEALIRALGRVPRQRTTLYGDAPAERRAASFGAAPLTEPINTPARRWERHPESAPRRPIDQRLPQLREKFWAVCPLRSKTIVISNGLAICSIHLSEGAPQGRKTRHSGE